jgi:hypothetical protein
MRPPRGFLQLKLRLLLFSPLPLLRQPEIMLLVSLVV